ncbi:MAG: hypothetical protein J6B85_03865 [Lachnospiraceae bacterium]|nr:hypothetical protein [Lachnospiraceae bacterium]
MNELYAEAGCKRQNNGKVLLQKVGLIAAVVLIILVGFLMMNTIVMFVGMLGVIGIFFLLPNFNVEYEYVFVDGQLDFDKIMGKSRRKNALRIQMEQVELVAPTNSHSLDSYKNMNDVKVRNFASGDPNAKVYEIIHREGEKTTRILFEPSEKMISCMKLKSPRKISEY